MRAVSLSGIPLFARERRAPVAHGDARARRVGVAACVRPSAGAGEAPLASAGGRRAATCRERHACCCTCSSHGSASFRRRCCSTSIWTPLYPWDAWIQWATKARVWYSLGHIVPFGRTDAWFAANGAIWFDASPNYPATVPLWQVWSSLALGRWDDALMNLPWWLTAVAFAIAIYGALA